MRCRTKYGTRASLLFQFAGIRKHVVCVSQFIDEGRMRVFDTVGVYLSHKVAKTKIMMDRTRGDFHIEACVVQEDGARVSGGLHEPGSARSRTSYKSQTIQKY